MGYFKCDVCKASFKEEDAIEFVYETYGETIPMCPKCGSSVISWKEDSLEKKGDVTNV